MERDRPEYGYSCRYKTVRVVENGITCNFSKEFGELQMQSEALVQVSYNDSQTVSQCGRVIIMVEGKEYDGGQISVSAFANEY